MSVGGADKSGGAEAAGRAAEAASKAAEAAAKADKAKADKAKADKAKAEVEKSRQGLKDFMKDLFEAPPATTNSRCPPGVKDYKDLSGFAERSGFTVTSTMGGKHNVGSAHYEGRAVDVRTHDHTRAQVDAFIDEARACGIKAIDERSKPAGQKEWSGPHVHLEVSR